MPLSRGYSERKSAVCQRSGSIAVISGPLAAGLRTASLHHPKFQVVRNGLGPCKVLVSWELGEREGRGEGAQISPK